MLNIRVDSRCNAFGQLRVPLCRKQTNRAVFCQVAILLEAIECGKVSVRLAFGIGEGERHPDGFPLAAFSTLAHWRSPLVVSARGDTKQAVLYQACGCRRQQP